MLIRKGAFFGREMPNVWGRVTADLQAAGQNPQCFASGQAKQGEIAPIESEDGVQAVSSGQMKQRRIGKLNPAVLLQY